MGAKSTVSTFGKIIGDGVARLLTLASALTVDGSNVIVEYHSVGAPGRYDNVSVSRFRRDIAYLNERYEIVDLATAVATEADEKRVALTFDDGYANFYTDAYPVIREFDVPATLFVNAGLVGGRHPELLQRYRADPSDLTKVDNSRPTVRPEDMLTEAQLRELTVDERISIGNHTKHHADLSTIDDEETLREEIIGGKEQLESMLGTTVDRFCYPYGRFSNESVSLVRTTHDLAVASKPGLIRPRTDRYALPRVSARTNEARFRCNLTDTRWRVKRIQAAIAGGIDRMN